MGYTSHILIIDSVFKNLDCVKEINSLFLNTGTMTLYSYTHLGGDRRNNYSIYLSNITFEGCNCPSPGALAIVNYEQISIINSFFYKVLSKSSDFYL